MEQSLVTATAPVVVSADPAGVPGCRGKPDDGREPVSGLEYGAVSAGACSHAGHRQSQPRALVGSWITFPFPGVLRLQHRGIRQ